MEKYFWDTQLEYLKSTREQMWNDDYFEFLVKSVWKFNTPKRIIDFGCGYGYLGMKLLPLLPAGSSYTGVDMAEELLNEARETFANAPFQTEFICADLNSFVSEKQYDISICQAVLRHIPKSKVILSKMIDSVSENGTVICVEVNRRMENAGLYIDKIDISQNDLDLNEQWKKEIQNGGRDYMLGVKVPIFMEQLGLKNVGVRVNDFVEFVSPLSDKEYYKHKEFLLKSNGFQNIDIDVEAYALKARCLLISYGTK